MEGTTVDDVPGLSRLTDGLLQRRVIIKSWCTYNRL